MVIDAAVIEGFRGGEPEAVRAVYRTYGPVVFAVTMLATYIPARRASRINPTEALRYE